jgi:hypothetical protein
MANQFVSLPLKGGTGVTSLNGETGALTLLGGSGISITPGGTTITISSTSAALVFADSLVDTSGTVTLVGDTATPGASQYYGTNSGSTLGYYNLPAPGTGTVTSVSVVSANGFTGTVATSTTTPAITLATSITGILQGNGTAISAATTGNLTDAGTDGITVTGGTGAVLGSGTSLAQHVADTTHNGYLSSTDWNTFNDKQSALTLTNLTDAGTDGITITNGTGAVIGASPVTISQHVADTTHAGYLSSTDWNTFNGKQSAFSGLNTDGILYATSATAVSSTAVGTAGQVLTSNGTGVAPTFQTPGAGSGTVTSVAMSVPSFLSVAGSPITTSGTLAVTLSGTALPVANGGTGATSFTVNQVVTGGLTSTGALYTVPAGTTGQVLTSQGASQATWTTPTTGTVTSVALSVPASSILGVTGSPVTSSGTLGLTTTGTTGGIPYFSSTTQLSSSALLTNNQLVIGGGATLAPSSLAIGSTGQVLTVQGGVPTWVAPAAPTFSGLTTDGIIYATSSSAVASTAAGTTGQVLTGVTSGAPVWAAPATSGTVTSVALSVPAASIYGVSGSPVTGSGTLGLTTTGTSGGIPYFSSTSAESSSALLAANQPMLGGGAGTAPYTLTNGSAGQVLTSAGTTLAPTWTTPTTGTVTSVALSVPGFLSVSGSPITGSGTLAVTLATQTANTVLAGPASGSAATPTFRALDVADMTIVTQAISALAIDWSTGYVFTKTLGANSTFTFSNNLSGQTIVVRLTNTASNYTVTWPTVRWSGGSQPTMTVGAKSDVYTFVYDGSNIYGSAVQNMS